MYRRPMGRRRGGLVGTMARTAVVAGTATAVAGGVNRRQQARQDAHMQEAAADDAAFQSQEQIAQMQAQMAAMQAQQAQAALAPAAPAAGGGADMMAQLQQLTQMKEMGALTEAEFQAAKARLLGL
jgi:Short C-terminal domain